MHRARPTNIQGQFAAWRNVGSTESRLNIFSEYQHERFGQGLAEENRVFR
ncbi:hypothetical protein EaACW_2052 [Erwinia amylovora ACW56400]|uniref:Uncharacterized protein n=3 Tax=Erwinia amylovora TaxID=552 RepID=A0A830ZZ40_ERWAM|nr:hypothetical protein EaACW_2052 [Erwinia amylovora ACW56400]CBA20991.1 hypothetical protein predicted by Glimmer/Critica [Erwinia amylovora CFBP1430]CBX80914.1 hypothetical protein predicted by Glimmer/Critica [Erwinia amylovora ATCC BAA-2158]CCO78898.1 hypothetical protein BN432_2102 [Erwinia amylovora Ea356]CCO82696.1 hypothetical protein BN433_2127 [Erwinia amylovora Ea266]CCO86477.1 hypothetical protein BN434_2091 [Erwinia amylovora CFBP 2585]CCO90263.1 hypothetical protein BN435_2094 